MFKNLTAISGVEYASVASGLKKDNKLDLSLITLAKDSVTSAVFTKNIFCAAPVIVAKNHLQKDIRAILVNSGNANAGTGKKGLDSCYESCAIFAEKLNLKAGQILPFSTGVIGRAISIIHFKDSVDYLTSNLHTDNIKDVANAILTTDTVEKYASSSFEFNGEKVNISAIAKGSGMIRPDMATMLSFIFTDISATKEQLQECLNCGVDKSFNRISVDGDTSTNDACTLSATNKSKIRLEDCKKDFQKALNSVMLSLAHQIVRDGEGATKFVQIRTSGMKTKNDCLEVAYNVANSLLVKTALFSSKANWGRILAVIGRSKIDDFSIKDINIYINDLAIISFGELDVNYKNEYGDNQMAKKDIIIDIQIGDSDFSESVWTTDLSYEYVKINSEYLS